VTLSSLFLVGIGGVGAIFASPFHSQANQGGAVAPANIAGITAPVALPAISALSQTPNSVAGAPATPLTLADVLQQAEARYPKLLGGEAERRAAREKRRSKTAAFDPSLVSNTETLRYNSSTTRGKESTYTASESGIELLTRSGLKLFAGGRGNTGAVKSPLSSTGTGGEYYIGVKMPLLRGLGINDKLAAERQAILGEPLADQNFAVLRLNTLLQVSLAYWDWAAAGRKRAIAENLVEIARIRADAIRVRAERGDLPLIDVVEADSETVRRDGARIKAERDLQKAALKLGLYLWDGDGDAAPIPRDDRLPLALPVPAPMSAEMVAAARERAVLARPERRGLLVSRDILRVDADLARNDRKPNLDLVFNPGLDTGRNGIGDTLKAGIAFSLPLGQREAAGRLGEAQLKIAKLDQEERLLAQQIRTEVNDAVSAAQTSWERYQAAVREVELARRLEQGERDRLLAGEGTLFLVNQRERATAEAEARLVDVQAEAQQAAAFFQAATAQL